MRIKSIIFIGLIALILPNIAINIDPESFAKEEEAPNKDEEDNAGEEEEPKFDEDCPKIPQAPKKKVVELSSEAQAKKSTDPNKDIEDIISDIFNKNFLAKEDTFFNFMDNVIVGLDHALGRYRLDNDLKEEAVFLIFKGGNVLRMIAERAFSLLPAQASSALKYKYADYFKRSDNDFAVYIDEKLLNDLDYNQVFVDVSNKVFEGLDKIRNKLTAEPKDSFDFFQLEEEEQVKILNKAFIGLDNIDAVKDPNNKNWYMAKFSQMQILNIRANEQGPNCPYVGDFDFSYDKQKNKIIIEAKSDEPNWIANTDNKDVEIPWGSDTEKKYKFALLRSKLIFDFVFDIYGERERKPLGAGIIDVAIIHKEDDSVRKFLDNFQDNIVSYTISDNFLKKSIGIKAHSLSYLMKDIIAILFETFDRPWKNEEKFEKRLNRFFFLSLLEMFSVYGVGSDKIASYADFIEQNIIKSYEKLLEKKDNNILKAIKEDTKKLMQKHPKLQQSNSLWQELAIVAERLVNSPEEGDEEGLQSVIDISKDNILYAKKFEDMLPFTLDVENLYKVDIRNLF